MIRKEGSAPKNGIFYSSIASLAVPTSSVIASLIRWAQLRLSSLRSPARIESCTRIHSPSSPPLQQSAWPRGWPRLSGAF